MRLIAVAIQRKVHPKLREKNTQITNFIIANPKVGDFLGLNVTQITCKARLFRPRCGPRLAKDGAKFENFPSLPFWTHLLSFEDTLRIQPNLVLCVASRCCGRKQRSLFTWPTFSLSLSFIQWPGSGIGVLAWFKSSHECKFHAGYTSKKMFGVWILQSPSSISVSSEL